MPVFCSAMLCLPGLAIGADGGRSSVVSLPVSTVDLSPTLLETPPASYGRSLGGATTIATTSDTSTTLPSLPQGNAEASFVGGLYEAFKSRGENMLTPDGAAATLRGVESGGIAGLGANLAQSVIDAGLQRIEQQAGQHLFRNLNLNWAPGFNGRKDLYQIDAMLSLYDGERSSLMTQLGLQGRDGEAGANAGIVLRTQSFEKWLLGFNAFYDYLSDPDVSRWSVGAELKGRWIGLSSNIYIGLDEETRGREILYSPDGWDVELSGHVPDLPWLEYSGRYYNWDGEGSPDLEGQDYKLTLRPVPLFDISLRYDNAKDSDSGFGVETQLSYEFGRPMSEQLSYQQVASPASAWSRRFERVRREYEQRVQRRSGVPVTSVTRVTTSSNGVVVQIANIPAGTTQVVVTGGIRTGNSLTRATSASNAPAVRVHGGNCHIPSISTASCTFNATTSEITIANLQPGNYNFGVSFQNAAGTDLGGQVQFTVTITGPTASIAVNNAAIAEAGGVATVTVTLDPAPASATVVNLARTGTGTVVSDYTVATLAGTDPTYTLMVAANTATATFTVTAVDDSADDDAETAIFTISSVTGYTATAGAAAVTVTITDDDDPPTASIYIGNAGTQIGTITEAAASTTTVTVRLSPAPTSATVVNLARTGSGTVVSDYTVATLAGTDPTYTLMVAANTATATFTVTAVDDSADDDAETAIFTISSVTGYTPAAGGAAAVTVTITDDDDPPTASIYIGNAGTQIGTITEAAASSTTVTVRLSPAPTSPTTVSLMQSGTATVTSDYTVASLSGAAPTYTLMVAANTATATFTVTAVDDSADDDAETAIFTIASVTGYTPAAGGASAVTVTITDDDDPPTPTASIAVNNPTITEAGTGSATVTVTLSSAPTTATTVNLTSSGSATIGTGNDYTVATLAGTDPAYTLTVPASMTTATFTLTAVDDTVDDDDETAVFMVVAGTGYTPASGGAAAVTVTITDNDTRSVISSTSGANLAVTEESTNSYTIVLGSQPTGTVTVTLTSADTGAATVAPATLSFTTANWNTAQTVTVTGVDDTDTTNESTTISYAVSGGDYAGVTLAAQTVTVNDNDIADITATAGAGSVVLTWTNPTNSNLSSVVVSATVNGAVVDLNGATGGNDITIASAMSGASVNRSISGLTAAEHTFTIVAMDAGSTSIASGTATATPTAVIIGAPVVTVTPSATTVPEGSGAGNGGVVTLTLTLTNPPVTDVTVTVSRNGSSAAAASDYSLSAPTATLNATTTSVDITLTTTPDTVYEGDESLVLSYTVVSTATIAAVPDTTLTITEDDAQPMASVYIGVASTQTSTITEAGTSSTTVTVALSSMSGSATTVNLMRSGDATIGTGNDYTVATLAGTDPAYTLMVPALTSTATFTLTAVDDSADDDAETAIFTIATGTGYTPASGGAAAVTVTITDNDTRSITSSTGGTNLAVPEESTNSYTIVLGSQPTGPVTVAMTSADTGAATVSPATLSFTTANWNTAQTVTVAGVTDADLTNESTTISYVISGGDYAGVTLAAQTVTVTDNDVAIPTASIAVNNPTITEAGTGSTTVTVTLSSAPTTATTVRLDRSGSATIGTGNDYTVATLAGTDPAYTLTVPANMTTATFTVTAVDDMIDENNETVIFTLATGGTGYTVGTPSAVTVTITDNDTRSVISSTGGANLAVTEESTNSYTIVLGSQPTGTVTVTLTSVDTGAATVAPATLSFTTANWNTAQTVTVTGVDDTDTTNESTTISYAISGSDYAGVTLAAQTVTVNDNDIADITATAGAGSVVLTWTNPTNSNLSSVVVSATVNGAVVDLNGATGGNDITIASAMSGASVNRSISGLTAAEHTFTIVAMDAGSTSIASGTATATPTAVTIGAPVVTVTPSATTVTEGSGAGTGGVVTLTLTLTNPPVTDVTVTVSRNGSSAAAASDYSLSAPTATLNATTLSRDITLTTDPDTVYEGDESLVLSYTVSGATGIAAVPDTTLTITEDDAQPMASVYIGAVSTQTGTITEAGTGSATVTVALSSMSGSATTVNLTRTGSATIGTGNDYTVATLAGTDPAYTFTVPALTSTATFTLTAVDDAVDDDAETAIFTIATGTGYTPASGGAAAVTVTITDNDTRSITSSTGGTNLAVPEESTNSYTIVLGSQPTGTVTVTMTSADTGAATVSPAMLSFSTANWNTAQTVMVAGVTDADFDNESTTISYVISGGDYAGVTLAAQTVTVTDNDVPPEVSFTTATATVAEGGGVNVRIAFTGGALAALLRVSVSVGGTAVAADYRINNSGANADLTNGAIELRAARPSPVFFVIFTTADTLTEGDETVTITLLDGNGYTVGSANTYTLTITNVAPPPPRASIYIGVAGTQTGTITEAGTGSTTVTVTLSSAPTTATTVNLTRTGSATIGTGNDYTVATLAGTDPAYMLTVPANMTTATFTVTAVDDMIDENNETVIFTLATGGTGYTVGSAAAVTVTITDNDTRSVISSTSGANLVVTEQSTNSYTIVLGSQPTGTVTVTLTSVDTGAATVAPATLSFTTANWNTAQTVTVTGVADTDTTNESTTISYAISGGDYAGVTLAAQTVTVNDNDIADITATAGAGSVVLTWTNPTNSNLSSVVVSATVNGAVVDINGATGGNDITIASAMSGASVNRSISGLTAAEHTFTIVAMDAGSTSIASGTATATPTAVVIAAPVVTVTPSATTVTEGSGAGNGGVVTLTLTLTNPPATDVTVTVSRNGSSAAAVSDYSLSAPTATLNATTLSRDITLTTTPDTVYEGDESLVLSYTVSGATGIAAVPDTTLTITEDDAPPQFSFPTATATVVESVGGSINVNIAFTGGAPLTTAVNLNVSVGGGAVAADYRIDNILSTASATLAGDNGTIRINAGGTSPVFFTILITADAITEGNETLIITLLDGDGYTVGTANTYTLTITDPPVPSASIAVNNPTITEAGTGSATVTVTLSSAPTTATTVRLDRSGSATIGTGNDYTVATLAGTNPNYMLTVPANMTTATFTVTAVDDMIDENNETVIFTLATGGTGYTVGSAAAVTVTITDNDTRSVISTGGANLAVTEESTNSYTIVLGSQPTGTVTVAMTSADTGAAIVSSAMLIFSAATWNRAQTVTVAGVTDADTTNESTTISYVISGGDYAGFTLAAQTVTVTDNDVPDTTPPGQVTGLAATTGDRQVVLTWTNPTDTDLAMVTISATVTAGGTAVDLNGGTSGNDLSIAATPGSMGTRTITGLNNGTEYTFSIVALDGTSTGNPSTAATITATPAVPPPSFSFAATQSRIASGATDSIIINFGGSLGRATTLNVSLGGTATFMTDYRTQMFFGATPSFSTAGTGTIMVIAGAPSGFLRITSIGSRDSSLIITLLPGDGYRVGSRNTHTLTIGAPLPQARLSVTPTTPILESGGMATVTVTLSSAPTTATTVNLTSSGTAIVSDYTVARLSGTNPNYMLTVPANTATATFTVTAVNDNLSESNETAVFTIATGTGYTVGTPAAVTVTIMEPALPRAMVSSVSPTTIIEAGGVATVTVMLNRAAPVGGLTVNLMRSGTATIGATNDYSQSGLTAGTDPDYSIMIAQNATTATFTLTAMSDTFDENNETAVFTVVAGNGYTQASGAAAVATVTITDDDDPPMANIYIGNTGTQTDTIAEAGTTSTTVTVRLSAAREVVTMVNLMRTGTATVSDYTVATLAGTNPNYMLTVPANMTTATFMLTAVDDAVDDDDETAVFTVVAGTGYTVGTPAAVTVTITDNDVLPEASIYIGNAGTQDGTIAEAGTTSTTVTVSLSTPGLTGMVTVNLMRSGTATIGAGNDYTVASLSGTNPNYMLTIPANMMTATFTLTAVNDNAADDAETAIFTIASGTGYTAATDTTARATVTITDDDVAVGPVTGLTASIGDGSGQVGLSWTNPTSEILAMVLIRATATATGAVVDINGATAAGNDMTIAATSGQAGTATITTGLTDGTEYTFILVTLSDANVASTPTTVNATPTADRRFGFRDRTLTITEALGSGQSADIVIENASRAAVSETVNLQFMFAYTSAIPADYQLTTAPGSDVSISLDPSPPNNRGALRIPTTANYPPSFRVTAIADRNFDEEDETFTITLLPAASHRNNYLVDEDRNTITITIRNLARTP